MRIAPDPGVLIRCSLTEERHGAHLDHFGGEGFSRCTAHILRHAHFQITDTKSR